MDSDSTAPAELNRRESAPVTAKPCETPAAATHVGAFAWSLAEVQATGSAAAQVV